MLELFSTARLQAILPKIKEFIEQEVIPMEKIVMKKRFFDAEKQELHELRQKVKSLGFWTPHLPEKDGGLGLSLLEFGQLSEILGLSPLGHFVFNCQAPDIGNTELLHQFASKELQEKYLKPLMNGEIRSCFSMTEPEFAGSNPTMLGTTAVKDGENYVINGHKWFTSSAEGAEFAVVMAVTDPTNENPYKKASMIIVPTQTQGFELLRNISIMGEEGSGHASHAEVRYTNCIVPQTNLIGNEGDGFKLAQSRLGAGRIHHCMRWIGICERILDQMCAYVSKRKISEHSVLADKQSVQHSIAECRASINAARYSILHTAYGIDKLGTQAMRSDISSIKFFAANVLQQVLDKALQVHGALGMTDDTILAYHFRHERAARIYDGADEVHKSVVARDILANYGVKVKI
ncbi:MAG: acyl-CoA dehydrogenase [Bacteroidetes bacterium]|nr:MAG: acyl-CoA dehydrogenase [Bacteroidota bacterium]